MSRLMQNKLIKYENASIKLPLKIIKNKSELHGTPDPKIRNNQKFFNNSKIKRV